jgi:DNA-binding LytR/AlgR family response regulator
MFQKNIVITQSLTKFAKSLEPGQFIRVSQSYLINVNEINSIDKKKRLITMSNGETVPFTITIKTLLELLAVSEGDMAQAG